MYIYLFIIRNYKRTCFIKKKSIRVKVLVIKYISLKVKVNYIKKIKIKKIYINRR